MFKQLHSFSQVLMFQPYERTNVCDALTSKTYEDGTEIISEVRITTTPDKESLVLHVCYQCIACDITP